MQKNDLSERLLDFAVRIVKLVEALPNTVAGRRIGDQLLRSGTSVGANYEEARAAESHNDFVHKLQVSLKEIRETCFWLRVLYKADLLPTQKLQDLVDESNQLLAILSKSVATAKGTAKPKEL